MLLQLNCKRNKNDDDDFDDDDDDDDNDDDDNNNDDDNNDDDEDDTNDTDINLVDKNEDINNTVNCLTTKPWSSTSIYSLIKRQRFCLLNLILKFVNDG